MFRVIACDDDPFTLEWIRIALEQFSSERNIHFDLKAFSSVPEMAAALTSGYSPDIIFLDILFPEGNGIIMVKEIQDKISDSRLVLITSSQDFALQGYAIHAYDYLLKPLKMEPVFKLLEGAARNSADNITIRVKKLPVDISKSDLCYVESDKHTLVFHTVRKDFTVYGKLDDYSEQLRGDAAFIRCHQSYLINLRFVTDVKSGFFTMKNGFSIPMRKKGAAELKRAYYSYLLEANR